MFYARDIPEPMKKQEVAAILRRELQAAAAIRNSSKGDAATLAATTALKRFQAARMALTHADLLASRESGPAARFFLNDLYGTKDLTQRDADLERIIPMMERILPMAGLKTIADAI